LASPFFCFRSLLTPKPHRVSAPSSTAETWTGGTSAAQITTARHLTELLKTAFSCLSNILNGQGGLLLTDRRYSNFELYIEVKAHWGCNSGIFLRSTEGGSAYQIELDQGRGTGDLLGENLTVSLPAKAERLPKVWKNDDWNSFRIRMQGAAPHITEWVNGIEMWDVQEPRNDKIAGETDGMIGLQAHWVSLYEPAKNSFNLPGSWRPGAEYQFRDIAIRELP
jgi:hypothetical protein